MSRNREQYDIESYGVSTREETWAINFVHAHLLHELYLKYDYVEHTYHESKMDPYKACQYKRSADLCHRELLRRGLFKITGELIHENMVKLATNYALPQTFKLECRRGDYSHSLYSSPYEAYLDVCNLKPRQFFHVYLHQDAYDIQICRKTVKESGDCYTSANIRYRHSHPGAPLGEREIVKLKVFLKDLVPHLIHNLCVTKMQEFLKEHFQLSSRIFYDLDIKHLSNKHESFDNITRVSDEPLTKENLDRRIARAQEAVSFFDRVCEELKVLRAKMETEPTLDFGEDAYQKAIGYFKEYAPLHINDEDVDVKHLVKIVLEKGADETRIACEWLNPEYKTNTTTEWTPVKFTGAL